MLSADEIKEARETLGLSVNELAEALCLRLPNGATTIREWERGKREISGPASVAIELLVAKRLDGERILEALREADVDRGNGPAYIDDDELSNVVLDGRFDLERVAEILSERELTNV